MAEEKITRTEVTPKKVIGRDMFWYELDDTNLFPAEAENKKMIAAVEKALFIDADMVPTGREVFARSLKEENLFIFGRCYPQGFGNIKGPCIKARRSGRLYPSPEGEFFIIGLLRDFFDASLAAKRLRPGLGGPHR
jgi:hypothetical protein